MSSSFTWKTACLAAALCCVGVAEISAQSAAPLKLAQTIALGGVEGRIDHFAFDAAGERLFVCALGNNTVEVLDLRKGERIHSITGLGTPQGIAYIPELDRLFVANDKGGICKIYDAKSYENVGEIDFKDNAATSHRSAFMWASEVEESESSARKRASPSERSNSQLIQKPSN